jgi:hypothetical protein
MRDWDENRLIALRLVVIEKLGHLCFAVNRRMSTSRWIIWRPRVDISSKIRSNVVVNSSSFVRNIFSNCGGDCGTTYLLSCLLSRCSKLNSEASDRRCIWNKIPARVYPAEHQFLWQIAKRHRNMSSFTAALLLKHAIATTSSILTQTQSEGLPFTRKAKFDVFFPSAS